jgi:hypothetical protein
MKERLFVDFRRVRYRINATDDKPYLGGLRADLHQIGGRRFSVKEAEKQSPRAFNLSL